MKTSKQNKQSEQYFVILWQDELDALETASQVETYRSIKSFTANGKNVVALSDRQVASRARISHVQIWRTIPELIAKGMIEIIDYEKKLGGSVPVYKVLREETLKKEKCYKEKHLKSESVTYRNESVTSLGSNLQQSNKVNIHSIKPNKHYEHIDTNVHSLIKYFSEKFFKRTGGKYNVAWAKDGAIFKSLLKTYSSEQLESYIDAFFISNDSFVQQAGYTVGIFKTRINSIISKKSNTVTNFQDTIPEV